MNKQMVWMVLMAGCVAMPLKAGAELIFGNGFEPFQLWSDPNTWGGAVPVADDDVVIDVNMNVLLDVDTAALSSLTIHGSLQFDQQDLALTSDWIMVHGALLIGHPGQPHQHQATITLTGDDPLVNPTTRGLMVMGGQLRLHGVSPASTWTQIDQHIQANDTAIAVLDSTGWQAGDQIAIAPTDFFGVSETELLTIDQVNGNAIDLTSSVADFRWGLLQYPSPTGMSLSNSNLVTPPATEGNTPLVLDERAEVGNLTRNIVIQAPDDAAWQNDGLGAHVMIMSLDSLVQVDGVEFQRVGQAGRLGRYPFHWHVLSYLPDGTELGDATGHYLRNSSIHDSSNRCVTIHGTNGVEVSNNICFDVLGHAIFFEDAVERRNLVTDNLVMKVRFPAPEDALKLHDINTQNGIVTGSSGIWVTNPDNTVTNNHLADAEGFGLWLAFPAGPLGSNPNVPIFPYRMEFGVFDGNTVHSNQFRGVMFDNVEVDDLGTVAALQYGSTADGQPSFDQLQRFSINGWTLFKNGDGNFWDRVIWPTFEEFVSADSSGKFFSGSGSEGLITRSLLVGSSLNDFSPRPHPWMGPPTALATYHSAFDMRENIIVDFPFVEGQTSGAFATDDYYIRPVDKGQIRNANNLLVNSHPGYRSDAAVDENIAFNFAQGFTFYVFAGALWDPHGMWGTAENWSVYDQTFFTHGATCSTIMPASQNAASCDGEYFGVDQFIIDQVNFPWDDLMEIDVDRLDEANPNAVVGNWQVDAAGVGAPLAHMRHFAARANGLFRLDFPSLATLPVDVAVSLTNMHQPDDFLVLGITFDGSLTAQVFASTHPYNHYITDGHAGAGSWANKHDYLALNSRQAVIDSAGEAFWQDHANNVVWVKVNYANLVQWTPPDGEPFSDSTLYNEFHLRIWADD